MTSRAISTLKRFWIHILKGTKSLAVIALFLLTPAVPAQNSATPQAATAAPTLPLFSVATIKPNNLNNGRWRLQATSYGYTAMGVSARQLIQEAYRVYENDRILGATGWVDSEKFDLEAKVDDADLDALHKLDFDQRRLMLRALLVDRFQLTAHLEKMERPVYALIVAKNGLRIQETKPENVPTGRIRGFGGTVTRSRPGQLTAEWLTLEGFAHLLTPHLDRMVVDKTGLTGHYDFKLDWTPDQGPFTSAASPDSTAAMPNDSGPSIFTAVQEQLGLKLEAQKAPIDVLVIDHIDPPSPN